MSDRFSYRVGCWCRSDGSCAVLMDPERVVLPDEEVAATLWCRDEDSDGSSATTQREAPLVLATASDPVELVFDSPHDVCGAAQLVDALA